MATQQGAPRQYVPQNGTGGTKRRKKKKRNKISMEKIQYIGIIKHSHDSIYAL